MSAWPEAVWIVKKFEQNTEIEQTVNNFYEVVDSINSDLQTESDRINEIQRQIGSMEAGTVLISDDIPPAIDSSTQQPIVYAENTICFIYEEE